MTARKLVKAKRCIVCGHKDRTLIEAARVAGMSLDSIAAKYEVSRDSIHRHEKNHLTDADRASYLAAIPMSQLAEKAAEEGVSVLQYFGIMRGMLMSQMQLANSLNDRHAMSTLAGRLTEVLRAMGHASGELGSMAASNITINNVSIMNSPVFANLQANLVAALAPFPDARNAVIAVLRQMEEPEPMRTIEHLPSTQSSTTRAAANVASTTE